MCSCGETKPHRVAKRTTLDGIAVVLWSDGWVTDRMGILVGKLNPRSMWAALALVGFCDWAEVRTLVREWNRARHRLVRATDETARAEVRRRMWPEQAREVAKAKADAVPGYMRLYRELRLANGMSVDIRIR